MFSLTHIRASWGGGTRRSRISGRPASTPGRRPARRAPDEGVVHSVREPVVIRARDDMGVQVADVPERRDLGLPVEDVEPVAAEEREAARACQAVPQLLERNRCVLLSPLAQQIDHLAVDANPRLREAGRELVEQSAGQPLERGLSRQRAVHDLLERRVRVGADEQSERVDSLRVPARSGEALEHEARVRRARDEDRGLTLVEAGGEVRGDGIGKLVGLGVDLRRMGRRRLGPGETHRRSVGGIPDGRGPALCAKSSGMGTLIERLKQLYALGGGRGANRPAGSGRRARPVRSPSGGWPRPGSR